MVEFKTHGAVVTFHAQPSARIRREHQVLKQYHHFDKMASQQYPNLMLPLMVMVMVVLLGLMLMWTLVVVVIVEVVVVLVFWTLTS